MESSPFNSNIHLFYMLRYSEKGEKIDEKLTKLMKHTKYNYGLLNLCMFGKSSSYRNTSFAAICKQIIHTILNYVTLIVPGEL